MAAFYLTIEFILDEKKTTIAYSFINLDIIFIL